MSSNVAQNYPYGSENEAERAAAIDVAVAAFAGLGERIAAESTPLGVAAGDANGEARWWTWVCPADDLGGRLHVAGYAGERHAIYAVCDRCGRSFLR
ncbi:MAG: hypothetical protein ACRDF7_00980 [Candidatus Limnocylindrales bacterium]